MKDTGRAVKRVDEVKIGTSKTSQRKIRWADDVGKALNHIQVFDTREASRQVPDRPYIKLLVPIINHYVRLGNLMPPTHEKMEDTTSLSGRKKQRYIL